MHKIHIQRERYGSFLFQYSKADYCVKSGDTCRGEGPYQLRFISAGHPAVVLQEIMGNVILGGELISRFKYSGGDEGSSKYLWFRKKVSSIYSQHMLWRVIFFLELF